MIVILINELMIVLRCHFVLIIIHLIGMNEVFSFSFLSCYFIAGDDFSLFLSMNFVILTNNIMKSVLNKYKDTYKSQWLFSRMLAATVRSSTDDNSQNLRICSICSGRSHYRSIWTDFNYILSELFLIYS